MAVVKAKRVVTLADALSERRVIHLRDAAHLLGVSEMTVRRDIGDHADQFTYFGGHIMLASDLEGDRPYELATAADSHASAKREACAHAAKHVRDGETIFVDCGTTLLPLIDLIPEAFSLTVICYAMNVAERLARHPNVTIIMLGGVYYPASASFSGGHDLALLDGIGINVAFLSAAGVDPKRGATCEHFHEAQVKRKVIGLARENYLVVDASKVGKLKRAFFAPVSVFKAMITEAGETSLLEA